METEPGEHDLLARGRLPNAWAEAWRAEPYERVLRDVDGTWLDGFDMLDRTARVAGRLHGAGLRAGDRVLVSGEASADFVVAHCAALRLGLVVVPTNSAYTQREIDLLVSIAAPRAALIERDELRSWLPDDLLATGIDVGLPDAIVPELDGCGPDDAALLPFTSGTTGVPKGAPLTHGNLLASAEAVRIAWEWTVADTLLL
ncbi:MAG: malonyl-CoA/methylmalonyl-CoA synthetase [Actinomycetota bacterium]|nr:malonyl-CoA/methylmalonyl-CoA synthetase [Actinomycetota bacterium]